MLAQQSTYARNTRTLNLRRSTNPETFDYNASGVWTKTYDWKEYPFIEFDDMAFSHKNTVFQLAIDLADNGYEEIVEDLIDMMGLSDASWDGFTMSKNADNSEQSNWFANQWGNMAGGGIQTDAEGNVLKDANGVVLTDPNVPYLVGFISDMSWVGGMLGVPVTTPSLQTILYDTYYAVGMYVNSSAWTYWGNLHGDGFARALDKDGDYFKLIIHGLDENYDDSGKTVEYYLAKNEGGTLTQSPNWEWVDLSSLGEIGGLRYTMASSDVGFYGMNTAAFFCMDKLQVEKRTPVEYTYAITAPEGANVFVGSKGSNHYVPFTEKPAVAIETNEGKTTYYYNISGQHNYRVSKEGAVTQVGLFTPSATASSLEITNEELYAHSPQEINHDVQSNAGYNVADILLNINEKGYLKLAKNDTYQLQNFRTWQLTNSIVNNYFIEPDFHYTVINESGNLDNSVLTVNEKGLLTAVGNGTAIVLVTYDAMNFPQAVGGAFWSALWVENTGVFMVSVDAADANIASGMTINADNNTDASAKLAGSAVDAELDVFYYAENESAYNYTFTPSANVSSVLLASPEISNNTLTFTGFEPISKNADGSYTLPLIEGRNIVKLTSASGAEFQVLTAKAVNYTVSNLSNPNGKIMPGDEVSVTFNTLYHPANKLAGIYNMSAGIQYANGGEAEFALIGANQYTFASKAQEYKITIPADFSADEFVLNKGVIKTTGNGSPYGTHRTPTQTNVGLRTAYFGALPDIAIRLKEKQTDPNPTAIETLSTEIIAAYPNPFADYIVVNSSETGVATITNALGAVVLKTQVHIGENRIETAALPKGVYVLKTAKTTVKMVK